ncbi:MAG: MMPL family transporter [Alicyclobacillus sp.]|nr:MMPL family transporter [Alicyclobacillus sp.]
MPERYARWVMKFKWAIVAVWMVLVAASLMFMPKLQDVVARTSTTYLPNTAESMVAGTLANQVDPAHKAASTVIVAIQRPGGLKPADKQYLTGQLRQVDANHSSYDVTYVEDSANASSSVASHFLSKDQSTEIAIVGLSKGISDTDLPQVLQHLNQAFAHPPAGAHVYFTGDTPVQEDAIHSMQGAADKTAVVTVVLVLAILLIVFRSLLAPLLTLVAVGLSYLVSSGLVAWAAEHGLPVSTFTQTFLIAVLFGAGTDYTMILLNRFREELTRYHDRAEALAMALRGVSKTVVFSSLTVLVSFAVLYFANFGLYRSGVGVAIGVFVTLVTCLTLIPALMALLGRALYWPVRPKPGVSHKPSRIWGWTGRVSTRHPWWVMLVLAVVLLPVALLSNGARTFDPMLDIPNAPAVQGFHVVSRAFGAGQAMPTTVVLKTDGNLRTPDGLATIDRISQQLASQPGVAEVDSATRPTGKVETAFQLAHQNQQAASGLRQVSTGLNQLATQLAGGAAKSGQSGSAVDALRSGSSQVTSGAQQSATGASQLAASSQQLASGARQLAAGIGQVSQSTTQLAAGSAQLSKSQAQLASAASALANAISAWAAAHPDTAGNPNWQQIQQLAGQVSSGSQAVAASSQKVSTGLGQLAASLPKLQGAAGQVASGNQQLAAGANQLSGGLQKLAGGSAQVTNGISQFASGLGSFGPGLGQAASGTRQLQSGVSQVQQFLQDSSHASNPGFYVPQSEINHNADLQQALNAYISPDGHVAKFTVVLNSNPYSAQAIHTVNQLQQAAQSALAASPLAHGQIFVGGTSATQANMNSLSNQDFTRTMGLVFGAIFILLFVMLRSFLTPVFILVSLGATYFVTMGLVQVIAVDVMHQAGVSWAAPFFTFLLLVALGVDYSIFLMSRFDEAYRGRGANEEPGAGGGRSRLSAAIPMPMRAMRHAMRTMGGVVFSAALIMAGTFGSMIATGMATLVEIGVSVVIGLFLYTFVLLAFFMPAAVALIGPAHAWPFIRLRDSDDGDDGEPSGGPHPATDPVQ